jgi:sulfite exporter TauE/SafE
MLAGQAGGVASGIASRAVPFWLFPLSVALALVLWAVRVWRGSPKAGGALVQIGRASKTTGFLYRLVPRDPLFFGVISALLPCGALISAWALAALARSPLGGALTMLAFALTTGVGVVASTWLLRGVASMRRVWVSRALAIALFSAAFVVIARPILAHVRNEPGTHASCH